MFGLNVWAILVASIAGMALGALWYGPLFGKQWIRMMGWSKKQLDDPAMQSKAMQGYTVGFITQIVTNFVLAWFIGVSGLAGASGGLVVAFVLWLGFVATYSFGSVLWEGKSIPLWSLNNGYNLISLLIAGLIIGVWA